MLSEVRLEDLERPLNKKLKTLFHADLYSLVYSVCDLLADSDLGFDPVSLCLVAVAPLSAIGICHRFKL